MGQTPRGIPSLLAGTLKVCVDTRQNSFEVVLARLLHEKHAKLTWSKAIANAAHTQKDRSPQPRRAKTRKVQKMKKGTNFADFANFVSSLVIEICVVLNQTQDLI